MLPRRSSSIVQCLAVVSAVACSDSDPATPPLARPLTRSLAPAQVLNAPIRRLRRMSSREFNATVRDLLGDTSQPANAFLHDVYPNGYDNGSASLSVQSDQVVDYEAAAEALAADVVANRPAILIGSCDPTTAGDAACMEQLLSTFAPRAFRRPVTSTEADRLRAVFRSDDQANGFARGIQTVVEVVLQSPEFLYREELGPADAPPAPGTNVALTDGEVASELSYMLTGSIPDATLATAVAQNRFHTDADHRREATRLLATQGAVDTLRSFFHQWLATDQVAGLTKDATLYPSFTAATAASMASELDQFYDQVLWRSSGSLRELFTSTVSFADPTLAAIYGVPATGPGFQPVMLDPAVRPGVLSRAGFLAAHSDTDSSGPIARGVFLLQSIMCSPPPPRPPGVPVPPSATDPSVQNLTTRERFEAHVSNAFCAGCHTRIDGIGFGFEEFDAIGAHRDVENGQPVDSSGTVIGTGEIDGDFVGVSGLAAKLSGSRLLAECYARQAYRYAMGQVEPPTDDLTWLTSTSTPDARMTDALLTVISNPAFTTRAFE